jgi:glycosyltransferase involved in cell wall biosynthesis
MIWFKKIIVPYYKSLIRFLDSSYDYYILFTKAMNKIVNPKNKPYIVVEGISNNNLDLRMVKKERAVMHAGTLSAEYGLKLLLDAFKEIKDDSVQLWFFGNGDMEEYIEKSCKVDKRIKFFGFRSRDEVFKYEKKAALLINTRDPDDEYTKYSFPSKTFEYMVSGTPFLTTKLGGIPEEYYKYLYVIEEYNTGGISKKIEVILNKPQNELNNFGNMARNFVLENKNNIIQASRIFNLFVEKEL